MESEIETANFDKKGWLGKIKDWSYENWQTILVVLIVLIVGMSAYNYNQQNNSSNENQSSVAIIDNNESETVDENEVNKKNNIDQEENIEEASEADIENEDQIKAAEEDNKTEVVEDREENSSVISSSDNSGKIYTVYANRGEGITHLARRALNEYLQETGEESELTEEHEIYIEDYLQNRTGAESIEVNHQEVFSGNLIEEAISSAKQLTPKSLDNLKRYIR